MSGSAVTHIVTVHTTTLIAAILTVPSIVKVICKQSDK